MRVGGPLEQTKEDTSVPISPIPQGVYPSVTALDPKALRAKGITLVLADLDKMCIRDSCILIKAGSTNTSSIRGCWNQKAYVRA